MSKYKASSPEWFDPIAASTESTAQLYSAIREDIVSGRLKPNQRLVVTELAILHGSSTTPVREVLQILRGEGFVIGRLRVTEANDDAALGKAPDKFA